MQIISTFDIIYSLLLIIFLVIRSKNKGSDDLTEKYYSKGHLFKLVGAVSFCFIYAFYYKGGDTINYYKGVEAMNSLLLHDLSKYLEVLFTQDPDHWWYFHETGVFPPHYMFRDERTFTVIKITSLISIPAIGGYLATTILLAHIMYQWIWKLFKLIANRYPKSLKLIAVSFLYLPSVIFWGSGILKDTYTFGATCLMIVYLDKFFVRKELKLKNIFYIILAIYLIIIIKSYILFALLPGLLIYLNFERINKIKSIFTKIIVIPLSIGGTFLIINFLFLDNSDAFGKYSGDKLFEEAAIQQQDLTRDVYGGNSFDIGEFEPSLQGALSKFPLAVNAAMFRPYFWEVGSPTMILSGIENTFFLLLALYALFVGGPVKLILILRKDPFMLFSLLFTLILGFGVGLSTANFGALVRYKIPFLPFFTFFLLCISSKTFFKNFRKKEDDDSTLLFKDEN